MKLAVTVTHVCVLLCVVEVWAGYFSEAGRALFRKQWECFCCCSHICWKDRGGWVCHCIGQQTHDEVFIRNSHVHKLVFCCSLESDLRSSPRGGSRASFLNSRWQVEPTVYMRQFGFNNWVDNVNWPHHSDELRTLIESSVFESLYGGQFTLLTQSIKPNDLAILNTICIAAPQFL